MFIGHYAAGFALKSVEKKASLGMLFIVVQLVDYLFFAFVPFGIERFNLVENYTAINHLELIYYPYTHGLLSSFLWAGLIYLIWRYVPFFKEVTNNRVAMVMVLAVLSHWFLDLIVHTPDLPLLGDDSHKLGFGLWNNFWGTYIFEVLIFVNAIILYMKATKATGKPGKYAMPLFGLVMVLIYTAVVNMPFNPEETVTNSAIMGILVFSIFTAIAFWLDRYRT